MVACNRISDEPILIHSHVEQPSVVVVLDPTLIYAVNVKAGVPDDGIYLINTPLSPADARETRSRWNGREGLHLGCHPDIHRYHRAAMPNTPMMGALVKALGVISLEQLIEDTKIKLSYKLRPEVVEKNVEAIRRAYQEVAS